MTKVREPCDNLTQEDVDGDLALDTGFDANADADVATRIHIYICLFIYLFIDIYICTCQTYTYTAACRQVCSSEYNSLSPNSGLKPTAKP